MAGDSLEIESGGAIIVKTGGSIDMQGGALKVSGAQGAALTAQLTTISIADSAGTPDYALQALTTTAPYGLATAAEAITLLYVIKNLQTRMAEVETRLEAAGVVIAN